MLFFTYTPHNSTVGGYAAQPSHFLKKNTCWSKCLLAVVALMAGVQLGFAQANTSDYNNRGFEDGSGTWTTSGTGTFTFNGSEKRIGAYGGQATTNNAGGLYLRNSALSVSVPAGQYAHVILYSKGSSSTAAKMRIGTNMEGSEMFQTSDITPSTSSLSIQTWSNQNSTASSKTTSPIILTKSSSGSNINVYYDDIIIYASSSSTTDIIPPSNTTCFSVSLSGSPTSVHLNWVNGIDDPTKTGYTGVQGTLVLRRNTNSGSAPNLNHQGTYTTTSTAADGVNTISSWTIIANLPASQTYYTDNGVSSGQDYRYAIVHYDKALNYSNSVTSSTIRAGLPTYVPNISQSIHNITRPTGGTFQPGDIIQLNVIVDFGGWSGNGTIYNLKTRINKDTKLEYVSGSMKIKDNKGFDFSSSTTYSASSCSPGYTGASSSNGLSDGEDNNDKGAYNVAGNYAEILLGEIPTSQTWAQLMAGTNKLWGGRVRRTGDNTMTVPNYYNARSIVVASIQVRIPTSAIVGEIYDFGSITSYSFSELADASQLVNYTISSSQNSSRFIQIVSSDPSMPASYSNRGTNLFSLFNNGSFGRDSAISGSAVLTGSDLASIAIGSGAPGDGQYSVVKNTAAVQTQTNNNIKIDSSDRVHSHWYILGDHTGASDLSEGNAAVAKADTGGYMLLVNADYSPTRVVNQTVTGLCPGTYYNFKAWFRNVCPSCGVNSNTGVNSRNGNNYPTTLNAANSTPGGLPNLTFDVNNKAYYTTGPISIADKWIQKEFVFATGSASGDFNFSIRNNAPGGDGNDWALDDISIVTRGPIASVAVDANPLTELTNGTYCVGQRFQVIGNWLESTSGFSQYDTYQFQYAYNTTGPWTAMAPAKEIPSPNDPYNPTNGRVDTIISPQFVDQSKDVYFRMVVATQPSNISLADAAPCQLPAFNASIVQIGTCILPIKLLRFNAASFGQQVYLKWAAADIDRLQYFVIERSTNGVDFVPVKQVEPKAFSTPYQYELVDKPNSTADRLWYRLKMVHMNNEIKYSNIETVSWKKSTLSFSIIPNPAKENIQLNWSGVVPNQKVQISISTLGGQLLFNQTLQINQGPTQNFKLPNIPAGLYILQVEDANTHFKQSIKLNKL
ncbi:MAG TPA: T9SS type A sorting domain-containing protein [Phnomibacter sp.]|nr:T9SS type A sorting domain-containing protein [Phnomibacter sp.]